MEISGKVKKIGDVQTFANDFKKRELVITTEEQYPQTLLVEFVKDKMSLLDSLSNGDSVTVSINLRGREWTSPSGEIKYFTTLQGWRIDSQNNSGSQSSSPSESLPPLEKYDLSKDSDEKDDLPF